MLYELEDNIPFPAKKKKPVAKIDKFDIDNGTPYGDRRYNLNKNDNKFRFQTCMVVFEGYIGAIEITYVTDKYIHGTVVCKVDPEFPFNTELHVPLGSIYYFGSGSHHKTREIVTWIKENYSSINKQL